MCISWALNVNGHFPQIIEQFILKKYDVFQGILSK